MGKASYWQRGETIDYVNSGTEIIEANTVIVLGSRIGVVGTDILPGGKGSLHVTGVFGMPKGSGEIAAGADVYYLESDGVIIAAPAEAAAAESGGEQPAAVNNVKAGFAVESAGTDEPYVYVKINA